MSDELKAKVAALKDKREEMKQSRQVLRGELKDANTEERKEIIAEYKETNKARHQEIKENTIALKEEIRIMWRLRLRGISDL